MNQAAVPARFYQAGGTLKATDPTYVERQADAGLFNHLKANDYCYVLTSRQMGKSSLMTRTARRLREEGIRTAIVDLTQIGTQKEGQSAAQWYFGLVSQIARQFEPERNLKPWWDERDGLPATQRLIEFFRDLLKSRKNSERTATDRIVVFVDEIDSTIGLPFADDFFAALRACYNARANDEDFERLTFVLLGVATPNQLIQDPTRTPFNIGHAIELTDFTANEAKVFAPGLCADPAQAQALLAGVMAWTDGHPYLTQALCEAVAKAASARSPEEVVDAAVSSAFLSSEQRRAEANLKYVADRLTRGPSARSVLRLYRRIRRGTTVRDQPAVSDFALLKLTGVVKVDGEGKLTVRNRIYREVFAEAWVKAELPKDRVVILAASAAVGLTAGSFLFWWLVLWPRPYVQQLETASEDYPAEAYAKLKGHPRLGRRADELLAEFWDRRAFRAGEHADREVAILSRLKALQASDSADRRSELAELLGADYPQLLVTLRHEKAVTSAQFSPDGTRVVTASDDGSARVWEADTGNALSPPLRHEKAVESAEFSPDGTRVMTVSSDGAARMWEAGTGRPLTPTPRHEMGAQSTQFSADGKRMFIVSSDDTARVWEADTGRALSPPLRPEKPVKSARFSPDGAWVVTVSNDGSARVWEAATGKTLPLRHETAVTSVQFSRDGSRLVTVSDDGSARVWKADTGKALSPPLRHGKAVESAQFSLDGKRVVTSSWEGWDGSARVWEVATGKAISPPLRDGYSFVEHAWFSPDGQRVVTASRDGNARVWEVATGKALSPTLWHGGAVRYAQFSPDGKRVVTASDDGSARVWEVATSKPQSPPQWHERAIRSADFSADGKRVLTASDDGSARVWEAATSKALSPPLRHESSVKGAWFSADGQRVVTILDDGTARVWEPATGKALSPPLLHASSEWVASFSGDGKRVVTGVDDRTARVWEVDTGKALSAPLRHTHAVRSAALSADGQRVVTTDEGTAQVWEAATGKALSPPLPHEDVRWARFSMDGKRVVTAPWYGNARVWEAATGKELSRPDESAVFLAWFSEDGKRVVTISGGDPYATRVWEADTGKAIGETMRGHAWVDEANRVVTFEHQWLHDYALDGRAPALRSNRWMASTSLAVRATKDCPTCILVAAVPESGVLEVKIVDLARSPAAPLQGDRSQLLSEWQKKLDLALDAANKIVPRWKAGTGLQGTASGQTRASGSLNQRRGDERTPGR